MKIVQIDKVHIFPEDEARLKKLADFISYNDVPDIDEGIERLKDADILIDNWFELPAKVIASSPKLKMIAVAATGYEWVNLEEARKRNIVVCNTPGYSTESVAEHTIGLLLNAVRLSSEAQNDLKNKKYNPIQYVGQELGGKTLGIIGYGKIGKKVGEIAQNGFQMKLLTSNTSSTREELEKLLKESDIISINAPLTAKTQNMIGSREFNLMKKGVVIINTGRGAIIDERAFEENIKSGKVAAAGLDVLKDEPMDFSSPFLSFKNVVVTPHIASNTKEAARRLSTIVTDNIIAFLEGHPQNVVS